jgi:hypothetical protein
MCIKAGNTVKYLVYFAPYWCRIESVSSNEEVGEGEAEEAEESA